MTTSPYAAATTEMLNEIIRQAEARLEAQLTSALGADQRAMTFAGLLFAAVAALVGLAFGLPGTTPLLGPVILMAAGLLISAGLAAGSAQPTKWEYVGNIPSAWLNDIIENRTLHDALAEAAGFYDEMLATNEAAIGRAARLMRISMWIALAAAMLGVFSILVSI